MKINMLTSVDKRPGGGNRVMAEFANYLCERGHEVTVIKPVNRGSPGNRRESFQFRLREFGYLVSGKRIRTVKRLPWIEIKCPLVTVPSLTGRYLPEADVTFFSFESHLRAVEKLPAGTGKKVMRVCNVHFAQRLKQFPAGVVPAANSSLVKTILEEKLQRPVFLLVNGVNLNVFNNPGKRPARPKTVGMFFYNKKPVHKRMEDGFAVMEKLHGLFPELKFQVAGEWREGYVPEFVEFHSALRTENLVNFYRTTDIFIFTSLSEGCPNPPLEALACKCALVTTAVGGIADYTVPGETAFVCRPGNVEEIFAAVRRLVENESSCLRLAEAGFENVRKFSTVRQGEKLENILLSVLEGKNSPAA